MPACNLQPTVTALGPRHQGCWWSLALSDDVTSQHRFVLIAVVTHCCCWGHCGWSLPQLMMLFLRATSATGLQTPWPLVHTAFLKTDPFCPAPWDPSRFAGPPNPMLPEKRAGAGLWDPTGSVTCTGPVCMRHQAELRAREERGTADIAAAGLGPVQIQACDWSRFEPADWTKLSQIQTFWVELTDRSKFRTTAWFKWKQPSGQTLQGLGQAYRPPQLSWAP